VSLFLVFGLSWTFLFLAQVGPVRDISSLATLLTNQVGQHTFFTPGGLELVNLKTVQVGPFVVLAQVGQVFGLGPCRPCIPALRQPPTVVATTSLYLLPQHMPPIFTKRLLFVFKL
jgi:hypothetical protein